MNRRLRTVRHRLEIASGEAARQARPVVLEHGADVLAGHHRDQGDQPRPGVRLGQDQPAGYSGPGLHPILQRAVEAVAPARLVLRTKWLVLTTKAAVADGAECGWRDCP